MTIDEKLQLIEKVLGAEPDTLTPDTELASIPQWDSLNMLNLQIELTVSNPGVQIDDIYNCITAGDLCRL